MVLGDFNEILFHHEKEGGRPREQRHLQAFSDALADCALSDMGYVGDKFTWPRGRIRKRLDRRSLMPNEVVCFLPPDWRMAGCLNLITDR